MVSPQPFTRHGPGACSHTARYASPSLPAGAGFASHGGLRGPCQRHLVAEDRRRASLYIPTPAIVTANPPHPINDTGFRKMRTDTMAARTPLALPRTCSVSAPQNLVTKKLVRLTKNARQQLLARSTENIVDRAANSCTAWRACGS